MIAGDAPVFLFILVQNASSGIHATETSDGRPRREYIVFLGMTSERDRIYDS
jgi:hypothetical protein